MLLKPVMKRTVLWRHRLFRIRFPDREAPTKMNIWKNVRKYGEHGTSLNRNEHNSGRRRTGRTVQNINVVQEALEQNPTGISCRRNGLGLPSACFNRIVRLDLNWHPYRIQITHELKREYYARRTRFCEWFRGQLRNPRFLANLIISDEANFNLNGRVTTQNVRTYAPRGNRPEFTHQVSESREKRTVWMGLCGNGTVLGPFIIDGNVNGMVYLEMLNEQVLPELLNFFNDQFVQGRFQRLWWAQDGVLPHLTVDVSEFLTEFFGRKIIAIDHPIEWPPRSPDLTPCDK